MEQEPPEADQPLAAALHLLSQSDEVQPVQPVGAQKAEQKICWELGADGGLVV